MATLKNDLSLHNVTYEEAIEMALDKPLWGLMAASGATHWRCMPDDDDDENKTEWDIHGRRCRRRQHQAYDPDVSRTLWLYAARLGLAQCLMNSTAATAHRHQYTQHSYRSKAASTGKIKSTKWSRLWLYSVVKDVYKGQYTVGHKNTPK